MAEEIDLLADLADWTRLSDTECHLISHILAFFAASDGIINKNLSSTFTTKVTAPKARYFYGFQITVGIIHSKTFSHLYSKHMIRWVVEVEGRQWCRNTLFETCDIDFQSFCVPSYFG
jgi:ribonucleotide reductase beta subunit family protein with ferritin-like domain